MVVPRRSHPAFWHTPLSRYASARRVIGAAPRRNGTTTISRSRTTAGKGYSAPPLVRSVRFSTVSTRSARSASCRQIARCQLITRSGSYEALSSSTDMPLNHSEVRRFPLARARPTNCGTRRSLLVRRRQSCPPRCLGCTAWSRQTRHTRSTCQRRHTRSR